MDLKQVGGLVFKARVEKRLTQAQVAERANVSRRWVNMLENGKVTDIGYIRLEAILAAVGLELGVVTPLPKPDAWI